MTNFLKSTLSSLVHSALGGSSSQNSRRSTYRSTKQLDDGEDDGFTNRKLEIGDCKLFVRKKIGDGGFSTVYLANRLSDNSAVAVKRILADDVEQRDRVLKESRLWNLCNGPYIVRFISCARLSGKVSSEFILLCEYCDHGRLSDFVAAGRKPNAHQAFQILSHQTAALAHLHTLDPPVVHRDVKLENFLLTSERNRIVLKLCDFGSATNDQIRPNREWTAIHRGLVEDEYSSATTPAYRPPELLNTYDEHLIGCPMDMWALGCCFYQEALGLPHPFLDCAKLKIINADYKLPDTVDKNVKEVIRRLLAADPSNRVQATELDAYISMDPLGIHADDVNLRFLLTPPNPTAKSHPVLHLTSRLALLTAISPPPKRTECYVINNIPLSMSWLKYKLPKLVDDALTNTAAQSVLLYSQIFGRTVVAAASLFSYYGLCRHSDHFLHYLADVKSNSLQTDLPSTASRYVDYMFDTPVNNNIMYIKQLEMLPGNEPFSTVLIQVDEVTGSESVLSQSPSSCEWQREVGCDVYGDVIIRISLANKQAEVRFNTRYIPLTEAEISLEGSEFDYQPFGENWIESLTIEFMFTPDESSSEKSLPKPSDGGLPSIVKDERELKTLNQALNQAAFERSKFFSPPVVTKTDPISEPCFFTPSAKIKSHKPSPDPVLFDYPSDSSPLIDLSENRRPNVDAASSNEIPSSLFADYWQADPQPADNCRDSFIDNLIESSSDVKDEKPGPPPRTAPRPTRPERVDPLQDIFGSTRSPKMSLREMQELKLKQEENESSYLRAVKNWTNNSNHKIWLLLSHLQSVLPGDNHWTPVTLSDRSTFDEVKKCYRRAILLVHPDKNHAKSLPVNQQEACRLIFMELSEAWAKYQAEHG